MYFFLFLFLFTMPLRGLGSQAQSNLCLMKILCLSVAGMIVPYVVAYSMMWGAIMSWGIMWPMLAKKEGDWYPAGLTDGDFRGLFGYKVT